MFTYARSRVVRVLGLAYPVVIAFVVMGTANHYLMDALAGAAVALLGMWGTNPLLRLTARIGARVRRSRNGGAGSLAAEAVTLPAQRGPAQSESLDGTGPGPTALDDVQA